MRSEIKRFAKLLTYGELRAGDVFRFNDKKDVVELVYCVKTHDGFTIISGPGFGGHAPTNSSNTTWQALSVVRVADPFIGGTEE